jgi:uncharacterized membrane protein YfcA
MDSWIMLAVYGLFAGVLGGMGLGGGTLLIPALTLLAGVGQREAQGINLLAFLPMAVVALFEHIKQKRVDKSVIRMAAFGLIGAGAGAALALLMDADVLRKGFAAFLAVLCVVQFISGEKANKESTGQKK